MSTATHDSSTPHSPPPHSPTSFTPDQRDRQIFRLVKFHGQRQSQVARDYNISQATVSRIVQRYERWLAHGGPANEGEPTHEERLRSQLWLTYERNEHIIASALRLADEMEQSLDASKSTVSHPLSDYTKETSVRTEHKVIDRSGIAARFLRLAHRINMDQLALVERLELPALSPLEEVDDIPAEEPRPRHEYVPPAPFDPSSVSDYVPQLDLDPDEDSRSQVPLGNAFPPSSAWPDPSHDAPSPPLSPWQSMVAHSASEISDSSPVLNNLNNDSPSHSPLTDSPEATYNHSRDPKKPATRFNCDPLPPLDQNRAEAPIRNLSPSSNDVLCTPECS